MLERATERGTLAQLAADLGHPTIDIGGFEIAGVDAWAAALDRATPGERRRILTALGPVVMAATEGARARHEYWERAGTPRPSADWVDDHLVIAGAARFMLVITEAIAAVPDAVKYYAVQEVAYVTVDGPRSGFFSSSVLVGPEGGLRSRMIVLGPSADLELVLHELGHAWLSPFTTKTSEMPPAAVTALGEVGLRALPGWPEAMDKYEGQQERLADALGALWSMNHRTADGAQRNA